MLTDMQLRALKPAEKIYKVADQQGLYIRDRNLSERLRFEERLKCVERALETALATGLLWRGDSVDADKYVDVIVPYIRHVLTVGWLPSGWPGLLHDGSQSRDAL